MMKFNRTFAGLAAGTAASAAAVALSMGTAHAATTYTPTGGSVNFEGDNVVFSAAGQDLSCEQFDLGGSVVDSGTSRAYGDNGGSLDALVSDNCTNPIAGATTVDPTGVWGVTVTGDATGTAWPAQLTDVSAYVSAAGCSFDVSGTLDGTFDTSDQSFTPTTSGLEISSVPQGFICSLLGVAQGDPVTVDGAWTNTGGALAIANP